MMAGRLVFSHLMRLISPYEFDLCIERYNGNARMRRFSCYDQLLCMVFAQLTGRTSLRDIEVCLRGFKNKLYHAGFRATPARSTLADANERRDWRIFQDLAQGLMVKIQKACSDQKELPVNEAVFALDTTNIELCLSLFPWARFTRTKGAVRLHTLLDLHSNIPVFIRITDGKVYDTVAMDHIIWQPGAWYVMDRGYIDFIRLHRITTAGAFFVIRGRKRLNWQRIYSHSCAQADNIICDQTIAAGYYEAKRNYPAHLRRIRSTDKEKGTSVELFTNSFDLPAQTIAELYRARWQIELFFKWIKQHLRIKSFFGTSKNAVKIQIWTAMITYLLIVLIRVKFNLPQSIYTLSQLFSLTVFEKTADFQGFIEQHYKTDQTPNNNQLILL